MNVHMAHQIGTAIVRTPFRRRPQERDGSSTQDDLDVDDVDRPVDRVAPRVLERRRASRSQFGGVVAVNDLSLEVRPGEVHGLIGPNGAGKTTVIDAITGFVQTASAAHHDRRRPTINRWSARRRARAGAVALVPVVGALQRPQRGARTWPSRATAADGATYLTDLVRPGKVRLSADGRGSLREFELLEDVLDAKPDCAPVRPAPHGRHRPRHRRRSLGDPARRAGVRSQRRRERRAGPVIRALRRVAGNGGAAHRAQHRPRALRVRPGDGDDDRRDARRAACPRTSATTRWCWRRTSATSASEEEVALEGDAALASVVS